MAALTAEHGTYFDPDTARASTKKGSWWELFSPTMIRSTIFCSSFWFAFAVSLLRHSNVYSQHPQAVYPGLSGPGIRQLVRRALLGVAGAAIGMYTVERFGRRKQIIWCFVGMILVLVTLAVTENPNLAALTVLLSVAILWLISARACSTWCIPTNYSPRGYADPASVSPDQSPAWGPFSA